MSDTAMSDTAMSDTAPHTSETDMMTRIAPAALTALTALTALLAPAIASAESPPDYDAWADRCVLTAQLSDAPPCLMFLGTTPIARTDYATLAVENGCAEPITLSCGPYDCDAHTTPAEGAPLTIEPGAAADMQLSCAYSATLRWSGAADEGEVEISNDAMFDYECGLSALTCAAAPGARGTHAGWFTFGLLALIALRRQRAQQG